MRAEAINTKRLGRSRARKPALSASEERNQLLAEIKDDIAIACPEYADLAKTLRSFAARYLVKEEPQGLLLGVVSAESGEGRTTVSLGLAGALADMCANVVLIEMAAQQGSQPSFTEELGLSPSAGLAGVLQERASIEDVVQPTAKGNLWILPAGQNGKHDGRVLSPSATRALLAKLRGRYAVSLFDVPAVLEDEEAPSFVGQLDGAVLVVSAGKTTVDEVNATMALLGDVPLRGVLLNQVHEHAPRWLASLLEA
ncbi:MAG: CpsD/CapB family tyrosine-protein kinase [Dehalococcoidia bacterium]